MAAVKLLLSEARRHCTTVPPSPLSLLLRYSYYSHSIPTFLRFERHLSSSSSSPTESIPEPPETSPAEPTRRSSPSVPIQAVSYPSKPKDPSIAEQPLPQSQPPPPAWSPPRQEARPGSPLDSVASGARTWTRDEVRYMKDAPSISPVSYPTKVAPLPEDRVAAEQVEEGEREAGKEKEDDDELGRERRRIEVGSRAFRRVVEAGEEEKQLPFPTLIKAEKKEGQKNVYDLQEAIRLVKANARRKFDETVEAHVKLGLNMRRTDLTVRGVLSLPHGSGKVVKVAVFADGEAADEARAAGAEIVGGAELIEEIKKSGVAPNVDWCISTELYMGHLKKISMVLRSLMPNPRKGSVTNDVAAAVKEAKRGFIEFKMDKTAIVHVGLGKVSFSEESLRDNIGAFVNALLLAKPAGLKKTSKYAGYVNSFHLCSTMGPGFPVSVQSLSIAADHYSKLLPQ